MSDPNQQAAVIYHQIQGILAKDNWKEYLGWLTILRQDFKACIAQGATKESVLAIVEAAE